MRISDLIENCINDYIAHLGEEIKSGKTATASAIDLQSKTDLYKNIATSLREIADSGGSKSNVKASKNNSDNIKNAIDKKYKLQPSEEFFKFDTNEIHNSDKGALIKEFDAVQLK